MIKNLITLMLVLVPALVFCQVEKSLIGKAINVLVIDGTNPNYEADVNFLSDYGFTFGQVQAGHEYVVQSGTDVVRFNIDSVTTSGVAVGRNIKVYLSAKDGYTGSLPPTNAQIGNVNDLRLVYVDPDNSNFQRAGILNHNFITLKDSISTMGSTLDTTFFVSNIAEIQSNGYSAGDRLILRSNGANYKIQNDSIAGFVTDEIYIVTTNNSKYAVLQAGTEGGYKVEWFGAISSDGLDDTPSFQLWINALNAGLINKVILRPNGLYHVDDGLVFNIDVFHLKGYKSILKIPSTVGISNFMTFNGGVDSIRIEGVRFHSTHDQDFALGSEVGPVIDNKNSNIYTLVFTGGGQNNVVEIIDCEFSQVTYAWFVDSVKNFIVKNFIHDQALMGFSTRCDAIHIDGGYIDRQQLLNYLVEPDSANGPWHGIYNTGFRQVNISNVHFIGGDDPLTTNWNSIKSASSGTQHGQTANYSNITLKRSHLINVSQIEEVNLTNIAARNQRRIFGMAANSRGNINISNVSVINDSTSFATFILPLTFGNEDQYINISNLNTRGEVRLGLSPASSITIDGGSSVNPGDGPLFQNENSAPTKRSSVRISNYTVIQNEATSGAPILTTQADTIVFSDCTFILNSHFDSIIHVGLNPLTETPLVIFDDCNFSGISNFANASTYYDLVGFNYNLDNGQMYEQTAIERLKELVVEGTFVDETNAQLRIGTPSNPITIQATTQTDHTPMLESSNTAGSIYLEYNNTGDDTDQWRVGRDHAGSFSITRDNAGNRFVAPDFSPITISNSATGNYIGINNTVPNNLLDINNGDIELSTGTFKIPFGNFYSGNRSLTLSANASAQFDYQYTNEAGKFSLYVLGTKTQSSGGPFSPKANVQFETSLNGGEQTTYSAFINRTVLNSGFVNSANNITGILNRMEVGTGGDATELTGYDVFIEHSGVDTIDEINLYKARITGTNGPQTITRGFYVPDITNGGEGIAYSFHNDDALADVWNDANLINLGNIGSEVNPVDTIRSNFIYTISPHGEMYAEQSDPDTASVTSGTPVLVDELTTGTVGLFTHSNGRLTYTGTDPIVIQLVASVDVGSSANNIVVTYQIQKNGSGLSRITIDRKIGTGADIGTLSLSGIVSLVKNDYLELFVDIDTGSADIYTSGNISVR